MLFEKMIRITPEWQYPFSAGWHLARLGNFRVLVMEFETDTVDAVAFVSYTRTLISHRSFLLWKRLTRSGESLAFKHMA